MYGSTYSRAKRYCFDNGASLMAIGREFCENFTGGHCPYVKKNVPRSWCLARCKKFPSVGKMAARFTMESAKYICKGRPKRTDDQIAEIKLICEACHRYESDSGRCYECGCKMGRKMRWATTTCPEKKWRV